MVVYLPDSICDPKKQRERESEAGMEGADSATPRRIRNNNCLRLRRRRKQIIVEEQKKEQKAVPLKEERTKKAPTTQKNLDWARHRRRKLSVIND